MAEWLRRGLQILARRFDSGSGLHLFANSAENLLKFGFVQNRNRSTRESPIPAVAPRRSVLAEGLEVHLNRHLRHQTNQARLMQFTRPSIKLQQRPLINANRRAVPPPKASTMVIER